MKLDVEKLGYYAHDIEMESFEEFDDIYDAVMRKEVEVEPEDIIKLCNIFLTPFKEIHPHQYIKICKITFYVIDKIGVKEGFALLVQGLKNMPENHVMDYVKMLKCSYSEQEVTLFKECLKKLSKTEQESILKYMKKFN